MGGGGYGFNPYAGAGSAGGMPAVACLCLLPSSPTAVGDGRRLPRTCPLVVVVRCYGRRECQCQCD